MTEQVTKASISTLLDPSYADQAAEHLTQHDPAMVPIVADVGPMRLALGIDPFRSLVNAIVGQQISVKAAASIRTRLEATMPDGHTMTPEGFLARTHEDLRAAGLSRAKALYVVDLAEKFIDGTVRVGELPVLPDEEIIRELVQVKGIGRWTAEMFLIFGLGRPDVLPVDDLGLRAGVKRAYNLDHMPTAAEVKEIARPWEPFRSAGTWYLWRSLRIVPVSK